MTYIFTKSDNLITISVDGNVYTDEYPDQYSFTVDALNNIIVIKSADGAFRAQIQTPVDSVTINAEEFTGTAAELKTALLAGVFTNASEVSSNTNKYYTALITQVGESNPTVTALQNTLGGEVVWTRNSSGSYTGTLAGAFPLDKTFLPANGFYITDLANQILYQVVSGGDGDTILIFSSNNGVATDELLSASPIQIIVFP